MLHSRKRLLDQDALLQPKAHLARLFSVLENNDLMETFISLKPKISNSHSLNSIRKNPINIYPCVSTILVNIDLFDRQVNGKRKA